MLGRRRRRRPGGRTTTTTTTTTTKTKPEREADKDGEDDQDDDGDSESKATGKRERRGKEGTTRSAEHTHREGPDKKKATLPASPPEKSWVDFPQTAACDPRHSVTL